MIDYNAHDWRSHLFDIKGSMVRQIFYRVLSSGIWAFTVLYLYKFQGWQIAVSDKAHLLVGTALGLLLVFRTNASYDRFWEGRKMWGSIINETRNLGRSISVYLAVSPELVKRGIGWAIAFPYATMYYLRANKGLGSSIDLLPPDEVRTALESNQLPLAVSRRLSEVFAEARKRGLISDYLQMTLDQNAQLLIDYMGACERIHRTPLPFAYVVHLRRALILFCYTLPFALLETFGWLMPVVTLVVTYIFLGIEEIGVEIEDPFGYDDNDLPLERFCQTIETNLRGVLDTPMEPFMPELVADPLEDPRRLQSPR
jgi:putative membrane protein